MGPHVRATEFSSVPRYADENGYRAGGQFVLDENDRSFRWNQMVNFSVNFFLPTQPRIGE